MNPRSVKKFFTKQGVSESDYRRGTDSNPDFERVRFNAHEIDFCIKKSLLQASAMLLIQHVNKWVRYATANIESIKAVHELQELRHDHQKFENLDSTLETYFDYEIKTRLDKESLFSETQIATLKKFDCALKQYITESKNSSYEEENLESQLKIQNQSITLRGIFDELKTNGISIYMCSEILIFEETRGPKGQTWEIGEETPFNSIEITKYFYPPRRIFKEKKAVFVTDGDTHPMLTGGKFSYKQWAQFLLEEIYCKKPITYLFISTSSNLEGKLASIPKALGMAGEIYAFWLALNEGKNEKELIFPLIHDSHPEMIATDPHLAPKPLVVKIQSEENKDE